MANASDTLARPHRSWPRRIWWLVAGRRSDAAQRRTARLGGLLGLVAGLLAGTLAAAALDGAFALETGATWVWLYIGWTVPGALYAGWRLGPGAVHGRLVWAAVRFGLLTTVATAIFWTPIVVVAFATATSTSVSLNGAVTTVGADIDPMRMILIVLAAPFFALFYAGFVLVLASPIVVPVSFGWAAVLRRVVGSSA
jgi:hypothetical protein